jgi:phage FluMu protein gp41
MRSPFLLWVKCFTALRSGPYPTLRAMDTNTAPASASSAAPRTPERIDDLYTLTLADGLPVVMAGKTIYYRAARLRDTNVADERYAEAQSERAMLVDGGYKLLVSESNFKHVLNMRHIAALVCDGVEIPQAVIDLALYDKLSARDLELLEQRIFLLTLAAEVRYGNMAQAEFEQIMAGLAPKAAVPPPQPSGQAARLGAHAQRPESGPALLADYAGAAAQGAAARADGAAG